MKLFVGGTGHTRFGKNGRDTGDLMKDVCRQALGDGGLPDAIYISNFSSSFEGQCHLPAVLASRLGAGLEATRVESACASGGLAIKEAALALLSGLYDSVLVVGVERMSPRPADLAAAILARAAGREEMQYGISFPGLYALMARRHFHDHGTTEEQLARFAVTSHKNALANPLAQFHKAITVEDVLKSAPIASPLKLLDCSPFSDGAAAFLLCRDETARTHGETPVWLAGFGHETGPIELYRRQSLTSMPAVISAARKAYRMAGIGPRDIDLCEVHDCFTIAGLLQIEDLGFAKKGEGGRFVDDGEGEIGGRTAVNPGGGLKAKGHPVGATGVSQAVEVVRQLRGEPDGRQVPSPSTGLCCNIGGSGATAVVTIFARG